MKSLKVGDLVVVTDEFRSTPFATQFLLKMKGEIGCIIKISLDKDGRRSMSTADVKFPSLRYERILYFDELVVIG